MSRQPTKERLRDMVLYDICLKMKHYGITVDDVSNFTLKTTTENLAKHREEVSKRTSSMDSLVKAREAKKAKSGGGV